LDDVHDKTKGKEKKQIDFRYEFEDSESYAKKLKSTII
jgi:hypothetical protein